MKNRLRHQRQRRSTTTGPFRPNSGENLFDLGDTPSKNAQFLLFLAAVIKASTSSGYAARDCCRAANDHRLGRERGAAPIRVHLPWRRATEIVEAIETGTPV
jgi:glutamine synthetase